MKKAIFLLFFSITLFSNEINESIKKELNLEYLNNLEKGYIRDFYINEYLKEDISNENAYLALFLINDMKEELFINFANKFGHDETLGVSQCLQMSAKELVETYADCIVSSMNINKLSKLSAIEYDLIKQKTIEKYPTFQNNLKVLSSAIPFTRLITQKTDNFYNIFLNVSNEFREKYFNYKIPSRTFKRIFKNKDKFDQLLSITLINEKLDTLNRSLLETDDTSLSFNSSFLLSLNAARFNKLNLSFNYLNNALEKSLSQEQKDKVNFYLYLITKDKNYLIEVSKSTELNFYSYLANEQLNIIIDTKPYIQTLEEIENLKKDYNKERIALLYSLAKVKSNFDFNKISDFFDIGMFQMKTNEIKSLYKLIEEEFDIFNFFNINENIKIANLRLNRLEQRHKSSVIIGLAFNDIHISPKTEEINYKKYFILEYINGKKSSFVKNFLLNYTMYYNSLIKKRKDKIKLNSIYHNLIQYPQTLDEK